MSLLVLWPAGAVRAGAAGAPPPRPRPNVLAQEPSPAPAPEQTLVVRLGFDGAVRVGVPVPLVVRVPPLSAAGAAALVVDTPALGPQAGTVVASTVVPFQAVPGAAREFDVPVTLSDIRQPLVVRVRAAGRDVLRRVVPVDPARVGGRLFVAVSADRAGLASLSRLPGRVVVAYGGAGMLPRRWQEYEAVSLLVLRDLDPERLGSAQRTALLTWIRMGGRAAVIVRPGSPPPPFLDPVLPAGVAAPAVTVPPAAAGETNTLLPPGPFTAVPLVPRPGADAVRRNGVALVADAPAGRGWVAMWGFDPWRPPFLGWPGRAALWVNALGPPVRPLVSADAVAARLPADTPLGAGVHGWVGAAILVYVLVLYLIGRRGAFPAGQIATVLVVCAAIAAFALLAGDVRVRSTTLTEVTFVQPAPGAGVARAVTVAAVAVPYGGRYRVHAPAADVVAPVAPSADVSITITGSGAVLGGTLRPGAGVRAFEALGTAPISGRAELRQSGEVLWTDLGPGGLRDAELRRAGRVYQLGDVPAGISTRRLDPARWARPSNPSVDDRRRAWIFRGSSDDAILDPTASVLVGELSRPEPVFAVPDGGTLGRRATMLLVPLEGR